MKPTRDSILKAIEHSRECLADAVMVLFEEKPRKGSWVDEKGNTYSFDKDGKVSYEFTDAPQFLHCPQCGVVGVLSKNPNKPTPKWEEEWKGYLSVVALGTEKNLHLMYRGTPLAKAMTDFIRSTLRECRNDYIGMGLHPEDADKKWGIE